MIFNKDDEKKFMALKDQVNDNICQEIYDSNLKKCKNEEDVEKLKKEIQLFKKETL